MHRSGAFAVPMSTHEDRNDHHDELEDHDLGLSHDLPLIAER